MRLEDADALRMLSDQLEEQGNDTGAALLRDIADRIEARVRPWLLNWPKELGVGELLVHGVEVRAERQSCSGTRFDYIGHSGLPPRLRILIEAEPVEVWTMYQVDQPDTRVRYLG
jgi:hypothetical protein